MFYSIQTCVIFPGEIDKTTFQTLTELRLIDVTQSEINLIQCDSFSSYKKLEAVIFEQSTINYATATSISGRVPLSYFNELSYLNSSVSGLSRAAFYDLSYVKTVTIQTSTLTKVSADVFDDLISVNSLTIASSVAIDLDLSIIAKLNTLEYLAIYNVQTSVSIDYNVFQSLTNLQTIRFDASVYQTLDFDAFTSLKTVELVQADTPIEDVASIVQDLNGKGIECKLL